MLLEFLLITVPVACWDKEGHEAVGGTAMSLLDSKASSKLKSLLSGDDASDVAGWAHRIEGLADWTAQIHYMQQENDWSCKAADVSRPGVCDDGRCLETSVRHFFRQLTNGERVPGKNTMKDDSNFTDADALRFLINLIGDISQALHVGFKSNNFGKAFFVKLPSGLSVGSGEIVTLYDLWDKKLTEMIIKNPNSPNFWWSGWTHARNLHPSILEREKGKWENQGIDAVSDWLNESAEFACNQIYTNPVSREKFDYSTDPNSPTPLSVETIKVWEQALKERILISGVRLGTMLNAILASSATQGSTKLRRGSVLNELPDPASIIENVFDDINERGNGKGRDRAYQPKTGYNAVVLNFGIMSAVVVLVVLLMKMSGRVDPVSLKAAKSHVIELVGSKGKHLSNAHKD